jgi:small-conductance mechanosensitive channel
VGRVESFPPKEAITSTKSAVPLTIWNVPTGSRGFGVFSYAVATDLLYQGESGRKRNAMKARQWAVTLGMLFLVLLAALGMYFTRGAQTAPLAGAHLRPLVDEKPLQTAQALAPLASDREQQRLSRQALDLGDHEVDLAFASALQDASQQTPSTPQSKALYAQVSKAQDALQADQDRLEQLKKQLATARASAKDSVQQQIDLTQAQLELDQDQLSDAKNNLIRSGADPKSRIQRQFNRHEAQQHSAEASQPVAPAVPGVNYQANTLLAQALAWNSLRGKNAQVQRALNEAQQAAGALKQQHDALEQQVHDEAAAKRTQTPASNPAGAGTPAADAAGAALASLHRLSLEQKDLSSLDERIQAEQGLADVYGSWLILVQSHQLAALHGMIRSGLWIVLVLLALYVASRVIDQFFSGLAADRTRLRTLRVVLRFAVQALAVLGILFIVLGLPNQVTTILGLAGAGLTIALKDFIVAFFGWFVLMGRNGIRVGDWVEIEGVGGEVVEIGLLRTVLMETGNWTDAGHPTGRKVAFVNSFAVEGHYFNFSTSGQWLWDELQVVVPHGQSPYPVVEGLQKLVTEMTAENTRQAELEWQSASTRQYRVHDFSAKPAIEVRPMPEGVQVLVRYITRAYERYELRTRLYQAVVDLMQRRNMPAAVVEAVPANTT